jgi:putative ABC transport system ATP-binding protein
VCVVSSCEETLQHGALDRPPAFRRTIARILMNPLISLRQLEKSFPTRPSPTWVLRQVSLDIEAGDFVTIMGPSGAGKSTLLAVIGLYDSVFEGEYHLDGQPVHQLKPKERAALNKQYVGFVFQKFHLLDDLTVAENLDAPLSYRDLKKSEREATVADTLDRFGIVGKKDLFPAQLSGGQQQLVAVARAVIAKPKLLLADEPTGNLHSEQGREIMELFKRLNAAGTTIIQVTHSETNAAYGNRIIRLRDGWMEK